MNAPEESSALPDYAAHEHLRHVLKTPLTAMHLRLQLVTRLVQRSSTLTDLERATLLARLAAIQAAGLDQLAVIETIGKRHDPEGVGNAGPM